MSLVKLRKNWIRIPPEDIIGAEMLPYTNKKPIYLNKENTAFIIWKPQSSTPGGIGTWEIFWRYSDNNQLYQFPDASLNRETFKLTNPQKKAVNRLGRIVKPQDAIRFLNEPIENKNGNIEEFSRHEPNDIFLIRGGKYYDPLIYGFAPDDFSVINYNAHRPRILK